MVMRGDGRGAGEAIVVLPNHMEMQMALSRDKQHMGRRYDMRYNTPALQRMYPLLSCGCDRVKA